MKTLLTTVLVVLALVLVLVIFRPIHIEVYLLAAETAPGWLAFEYKNLTCEPLKSGALVEIYNFSPAGYFCTSSEPDHDLTWWVYAKRRPGGGIPIWLRRGVDVHIRGGAGRTQAAGCDLVNQDLYYGPEPTKKVPYNQELMRRHPACFRDFLE